MNVSTSVQADAPGAKARVRSGRGWVVTLLLLAFMLINFANKAVLGLAAKPIMHDLGLSPASYGLLSSSFYFLFSVTAIAVGFIANRVATKWVLLVLALVWALTQVPLIGTVGFGVLLASRIVLGAAEGPANPVAMHSVHKWFPNEKRSLPSAILNAGAGIGAALAAPMLTVVIVTYGWHQAFFLLFLLGMAWVLLWAVFGKEGTIAGAAAYWALALLVAWIPPYFETVLGYSARSTGTLVVLPWVALAVFTIAQGVATQWLMQPGVSSRIARGLLGGIAVMISGLAMVLFPITSGGGLRMALITVAFSLGTIVFAIGRTASGEISPTHQRGAVFAITVGLVTTAGVVAPYVTGLIIQAAATPATGYALAFTLAGVLLLVAGLLAALFVRPERDAR